MRATTAVLIAGLLVLSPGCSTVMVGGGAGFDAGTVGVSGIETGVGTHVEIIGYTAARATGFGTGASFHILGFQSAQDADPMALMVLEGRHRWARHRGDGAGLFWGLGTGAGTAWTPTVSHLAVPLQVEIGVNRVVGGVIFEIAARERLVGLIGTGSPPFDAVNAVQVIISGGFDWDASRTSRDLRRARHLE
jgi:hypothetical protein